MFLCQNPEEDLKKIWDMHEVPGVGASSCVQGTGSWQVRLDHSEWEDEGTELGDHRSLSRPC